MNIVCVPYRPDTPERVANWRRTYEQWKGWKVLSADSDGEWFARSQAINQAVARAGDWNVLVIADSDLLLEDVAQAARALEVARETRGYILCYDTYYYLDEDASQTVRAGRTPSPEMAYYGLGGTWIGMFAVHRELWDAIGGFDEKIVTWGGEDGRFLRRCEDEEAHRDRIPGAVYHLKHPLAPGAR